MSTPPPGPFPPLFTRPSEVSTYGHSNHLSPAADPVLTPSSERQSVHLSSSDRSGIHLPQAESLSTEGTESDDGHARVVDGGSSFSGSQKRQATEMQTEFSAKRRAHWARVLICDDETGERESLANATQWGGGLGGIYGDREAQQSAHSHAIGLNTSEPPSLFGHLGSGVRDHFLMGLSRLGGGGISKQVSGLPVLVGADRHGLLHTSVERGGVLMDPPPISGLGVVLEQGSRRTRVRNDRERPWECEICAKRFGIKGHLSQHIQYVHLKRRPHHCYYPSCCASFGTKFARDQHCWTVHEKKKPFHCTVPGCGSRFGQRSHLNRHSKRHQAVNPIGSRFTAGSTGGNYQGPTGRHV